MPPTPVATNGTPQAIDSKRTSRAPFVAVSGQQGHVVGSQKIDVLLAIRIAAVANDAVAAIVRLDPASNRAFPQILPVNMKFRNDVFQLIPLLNEPKSPLGRVQAAKESRPHLPPRNPVGRRPSISARSVPAARESRAGGRWLCPTKTPGEKRHRLAAIGR